MKLGCAPLLPQLMWCVSVLKWSTHATGHVNTHSGLCVWPVMAYCEVQGDLSAPEDFKFGNWYRVCFHLSISSAVYYLYGPSLLI